MAYVNYNETDDMQDDVYKILTELFIDAIRMYRNTEVKLLFRDIDAIYIMCHSRMKTPDDFESRLEELREAIYSVPDGEEASQFVLSAAFDDLRGLLKDLTKALDDAGILFKMQSDLDSLVTRQ